MGELHVIFATTLDCFVAGSDGDLGWIIMGDDRANYMVESLAPERTDTLMLGRKTYQSFAAGWPALARDPNASEVERYIGQRFDEMRKIVYSRTLETADWQGTEIFHSIDPDQVRKLKAESKSSIRLDGSISVVQQMSKLGLIDEYRLMVHPVALGTGRPLFEDRVDLRLVGTEELASGVVVLTYRRAEE